MATKRDTRTTILENAVQLLWSQSYGGVSVDDICRQSGAKKGSFYHYFQSKAELAQEALELLWERLRPEFDRIFSPQVPPLERIRAFAEDTLSEQKGHRELKGYIVGCPFTSIGSEQCACDDGVTKKSGEILSRLTKYLQSAVQDAIAEGSVPPDVDARKAAYRLLAYELGAMSFARVVNSLEPLEDIYDAFLGILRVNEADRDRPGDRGDDQNAE